MSLAINDGTIYIKDNSWFDYYVLDTNKDDVYRVFLNNNVLEYEASNEPENNPLIVDDTGDGRVYFLAITDGILHYISNGAGDSSCPNLCELINGNNIKLTALGAELVQMKETMDIFTSSLADGILGDFYMLPLGKMLKVFCKYTKGTPLLSIVKFDQSYIEQNISGIQFNGTGTYVFDILIGELGDTSSTDTLWQDGFYVIKLHSEESDEIYNKPIELVREDSVCASKEDNQDILNAIANQSTEIQSDITVASDNRNKATIRM